MVSPSVIKGHDDLDTNATKTSIVHAVESNKTETRRLGLRDVLRETSCLGTSRIGLSEFSRMQQFQDCILSRSQKSVMITQQQWGAGSGIDMEDIQERRTLGKDSTSKNHKYTGNGNHLVNFQKITNRLQQTT